MGCFDEVYLGDEKFSVPCPFCEAKVVDFQTKDLIDGYPMNGKAQLYHCDNLLSRCDRCGRWIDLYTRHREHDFVVYFAWNMEENRYEREGSEDCPEVGRYSYKELLARILPKGRTVDENWRPSGD